MAMARYVERTTAERRAAFERATHSAASTERETHKAQIKPAGYVERANEFEFEVTRKSWTSAVCYLSTSHCTLGTFVRGVPRCLCVSASAAGALSLEL